jgi:hypothetical protein
MVCPPESFDWFQFIRKEKNVNWEEKERDYYIKSKGKVRNCQKDNDIMKASEREKTACVQEDLFRRIINEEKDIGNRKPGGSRSSCGRRRDLGSSGKRRWKHFR